MGTRNSRFISDVFGTISSRCAWQSQRVDFAAHFSSRLESNRGVLRDCELSVMAKVTHAHDGRLSRRGRSCLFSWERATRDHRNRLRRSNVYPVMLCASTECTWMRQMPPTACPNFKQQTSKHGRATERWFGRHPESPRKKHSQNGNSYCWVCLRMGVC